MNENELQAFDLWKRVADLFRSEASAITQKMSNIIDSECGNHTFFRIELTGLRWGDWEISEHTTDPHSVSYAIHWITGDKSYESDSIAVLHPTKTDVEQAGCFTRFLMDMSIAKEKNDG